jgi:hypothetical protein
MSSENRPAEQNVSGPHWQQLLAENHLDIETILGDLPGSQPNGTSQPGKIEAIQQGLSLLTEPGQVVELRILGIHGKKRTDSGYFDDPDKLAKAATAYDGKAEGLYFTLNPVNPALIARAHNRVKEYAEHTTSDHDIVRRISLPVDFDAIRPAGISSSDTEKQATLRRAWLCRAWLTAQGWPEPVYADSGNGAHLLYAIDLPNSDESSDLVKNCLLALSALFSDETVKVDASTGNASRIFKLYGTLACKGDSTPDRPHRRAAVLSASQQRQVVPREQLEALAARVPRPEKLPIWPTSSAPGNGDRAQAYGQAALNKELAVLSAAHDGSRNNQLFQSAAALFSLVAGGALERSEVWQALTTVARTIGLAENEARRTIESGEKHGLEQPRGLPTQSRAQPSGAPHLSLVRESSAPRQQATPPRNQPKPGQSAQAAERLLMHVDDLDDLPPIRWLIKGVLPANSLVELHGAPGAGKTQVMFDMAQTLAAGGQTVIYVVAEGLQGYRGRKRAWQQFRKQGGGSLFLWRQPVRLFEPPAVRLFIDTIRPKQPALVVFDTLSRCSLGADENNQKDMGFILEALDIVRRETGATVVAVHHTNAAGLRERGSTVIRGGMDVMIEVSKDDDLVVVSCSKMKDAADFDSVFLKPTLVDIGEENPVPVLVPAEKRTQTLADKLTPLQLDILRAVGLDMFAESGIRSNQLDELLPPTTKRATKYHSLNTLIRLGYMKPHAKGDPYYITDAGRLKLSSAENGILAGKSNLSNPSPNGLIWTLPDPCPMSSPIPHTCGCGMDETWDNTYPIQTPDAEVPAEKAIDGSVSALSNVQTETMGHEDTLVADGHSHPAVTSDVQPLPDEHQTAEEDLTASQAEPVDPVQRNVSPMSRGEIARYAEQIGVTYPTGNGADLCRIAALIPFTRRAAFEYGLGDAVGAYYDEVARQGQEPALQPIPDIVTLYVLPGLVSAADLFAGYQRACEASHGEVFRSTLQQRNPKAADVLDAWLAGKRSSETVLITRVSG